MKFLALLLAILSIRNTFGCGENNPTFVYNNNTCTSIRVNETLRQTSCLSSDVRKECPQTCGLCCKNSPTYEFRLGEGGPKRKTCEWLQQVENREFIHYCDTYRNGRMVKDACPESCNFCVPLVSLYDIDERDEPLSPSSPTTHNITSSNNCVEDHQFQIRLGNKEHSCSSIRNREDVRQNLCTNEDVKNACPISCGLCCADDPDYVYNTTSGDSLKCKWISYRDRKDRFCDRHKNGRFIRDACAESCGNCKTLVKESENKGENIAGAKNPEEDKGSKLSPRIQIALGVMGLLGAMSIVACCCRNRIEDDGIDIIVTENGQTKMIIRSKSKSTVCSEGEFQFPKLGVKASYLDEFIEDCGGRENLQGLTTAQVSKGFVKPMTSTDQCSLCEMLQRKKHDAVGVATIYISHVYQYEFLNVIDSLQYHLRETPDTIIWFDLFSMNKHSPDDEMPYEWYSTTLMASIKKIGHTIMVMSPWNDRLPHTRTWCIFEAYCTRVGKCKFEIALNANDKDQLIKDMENNPNIEEMIGDINFEESQCKSTEDREMMLEVIRETVGLHSANEIVFDLVRKWLINMAKDELEKPSNDEGRMWKLLHMLGMQFQGQGNVELSKQLLEKCHQQQRDTLGPTHPNTLSTLHNLADIYCKLEMYDKAKKALEDVFLRRKATLGASHQDTIGTLHNLAAIHLIQRDYNEAKRIYQEVLNIRKEKLGPSHPLTLNTLSSLAMLHKDCGEYEHARNIYERVLERRKNVLGESHPKTLSTLHNLASLYGYLGKQFQARKMFEDCLYQQKAALGDSHTDTLGTMNNLAVLLHKEGEYKKAADMYEECLKHQKATLGEEHPDTLGTLHNLALLYESRND